jgi:hypothetical protein
MVKSKTKNGENKMRINRKKVELMLAKISAIKDIPTKEDGSLDTRKYSLLPDVRNTIRFLVDMGITKKWLSDNGFIVASLVLDFTVAIE